MKRSSNFTLLVVLFLCPLSSGHVAAQDLVEFLNGSTATGAVKSIRKADKEFDFEITVGSQTFLRVYPFSKVHAVILQGKRHELTPKPVAEPAAADAPLARSKAEVLAVIAAAGETPPDWFDSTPLDYPPTLDLSWPLQPPSGEWKSHVNMGQYIWSVVNENPRHWRSGIKLLHHCVKLHKADRVLLARDMNALGSAYFRLMQDYPRAAFWFQKGKPSVATQDGIHLAECYWRLGNPDMAKAMLHERTLDLAAIKLLGGMGELPWALRLTKAYNRTSAEPQANILAADALRSAGRLDEAKDYYQRVIDSKQYRDKEYEQRFVTRAKESIETIRLYDLADVTKVADGVYSDSSTGYNGKLTVAVTVAGGRMESVKITDHKEKQFYSALTDTPQQLITNQGVLGIDATSGATITSQAIINATAKALAKGTQ